MLIDLFERTGGSFDAVADHDNRRFFRAGLRSWVAELPFIHFIGAVPFELELLSVEIIDKSCPMVLANDVDKGLRKVVFPR